MRRLIVFCSLLVCVLSAWAQPQVPSSMNYCGIQLTFTEEARAFIQSEVNRYGHGASYFQRMVERAAMHFPIIEEALKDEGAPDDLKFLCIQESAVKAHAVSVSNAVGFWQFKEATALEMGLSVTPNIDERKHIYRSTRAAARYFGQANRDFNNWLYAIISYYQGPTGAIPYTDPQYYGKNFMVIDGKFHPYALKAIAHKIAYEEAIKQNRSVSNFFMPFATKKERNWREVVQRHQISTEEFLEANPWIINLGSIPNSGPFTYYIPVPASRYVESVDDPTKPSSPLLANKDEAPINKPKPEPSLPPEPTFEKPQKTLEEKVEESDPSYFIDEAQPIEELPRESYALFEMEDDLHYARFYTLFSAKKGIDPIALRVGVPSKRILSWNRVKRENELKDRQLIYLTPPQSAEFYVVKEGDRLPEIAEKYGMSLGKLLKKNRMDEWEMTVYIGQKLYLKGKKPRGEKLIILQHQEPQVFVEYPSPNKSRSENTRPPQTPLPKSTTPVEESPFPKSSEMETKWLIHIVSPGESLWSISRKYGTKVEIIKRINNMDTNDLAIGQELEIMLNEVNVK